MRLQLLDIKVPAIIGYLLFAAALAIAAPTDSTDQSSEQLPTLQQVLDQIENNERNNSRNHAGNKAGSKARKNERRSATDTGRTSTDTTRTANTNSVLNQQIAEDINREHPLEALAASAGDFVRSEHKSAERVEVAITPIDRRLRLKRCDKPPVFSWTSASNTMGNTSITAACEGVAPWKVLLRARVGVYQYIPVLVAPVNKGDVLLTDSVTPRLMDVSVLRRETIRSVDNVVGYQFKRQLAAGREISSSVLVTPKVVSKGDLVLISASNQLLDVQMKGIALSGGTVGKKINVRSNSSGRVIQTWIRGPGQVEVSP